MAMTVASRKHALSDSETSVSASTVKRTRLAVLLPLAVNRGLAETETESESETEADGLSSSSDSDGSSDSCDSDSVSSSGEEGDDEPASPSASESSSSSSSSSSSEDELEITPIPRPRKPNMSFSAASSEGNSLLSRINSLLPALEAANAELERDRAAGTLKDRQIDNVDENAEGGYIEMDLGLGVLEERNLDDTTTCGGTSDDTLSSESDDDGGVSIGNSQSQTEFGRKPSSGRNIMGRLMGQKKRSIGRSKVKPMIVEVGGN